MKNNITVLLAVLIFGSSSAQKMLNDYSYVVVPDQYEFLSEFDQYQMNSMSKFYFEKNGFNAYMASEAPNANKCEGLFANVEELKTMFGTKLQIVLKDCNGAEVYRSADGKSKYKEFDKSYQDALRKSFKSVAALKVNQRPIQLLSGTNQENSNTSINTEISDKGSMSPKENAIMAVFENGMPTAKFSNYSKDGKTFLLRKTGEGYSLYEEDSAAPDGLKLNGKLVVIGESAKYISSTGNMYDATFDVMGNFKITGDGSEMIFELHR